jgi:hypothetical protein
MGLTSFPSVPIWLASQTMGLGTLYPPEVVWERCVVHDKHILTSCLLATALSQGRKQALAVLFLRRFRREFTLHFPYPLPRQPLYFLLVELGLTRVSPACLRTGCLTAAPHPRIAPDARTVKVTSFQTWFLRKQDTESGNALYAAKAAASHLQTFTFQCGISTTKIPSEDGFCVENSPSRANSRWLLACK